MDQRIEFALKAMNCPDFQALCRDFGISRKTGYKWRERFVAQGLAGLSERSTRPQSSPAGLPEAVVCEMVKLKQAYPFWGPRKIRGPLSTQIRWGNAERKQLQARPGTGRPDGKTASPAGPRGRWPGACRTQGRASQRRLDGRLQGVVAQPRWPESGTADGARRIQPDAFGDESDGKRSNGSGAGLL